MLGEDSYDLVGSLRLQVEESRTKLGERGEKSEAGKEKRRIALVQAGPRRGDHRAHACERRLALGAREEEVEDKGVVLVPYDDVFLRREVAEEGARRDRRRIGDLVHGRLAVG